MKTSTLHNQFQFGDMARNISLIETVTYFINFLFPRIFGLFAFSADLSTYRFSVSKNWSLYSAFIGTIFLYNYPRAIIILVLDKNETINVTKLAELLQYGATYVLTLSIYIRNVTLDQKTAEFINSGVDLHLESRSLTAEKVGREELILPYIGRALYSYVGHIILNYIRLKGLLKTQSENIGIVYSLLYFLPDIAITSVAMRIHLAIMIAILVSRRVNVKLKNAIHEINKQQHETIHKRSKVVASSIKNIEDAMAHSVEVFQIIHAIEAKLAALIIFLIANAVVNSTNLVL